MNKKLVRIAVASFAISALIIGVTLLFVKRSIERKGLTDDDRKLLQDIKIT